MPGNLNVLSHPLINTRLSKLRQTTTNSKEFREVLIAAHTGPLNSEIVAMYRVFMRSA
jgi:uracil phosphoribosyltransferase